MPIPVSHSNVLVGRAETAGAATAGAATAGAATAGAATAGAATAGAATAGAATAGAATAGVAGAATAGVATADGPVFSRASYSANFFFLLFASLSRFFSDKLCQRRRVLDFFLFVAEEFVKSLVESCLP